jgi:hypothetical protein
MARWLIVPLAGLLVLQKLGLGRLLGDIVIERKDVRSIASSIRGELLPNDHS